MITARWTSPRPLQRRLPRSTGEPASFCTLQARLPAPSRPPQHPQPLPTPLRSPQHSPIRPSCAEPATEQILGRPCNAHSQGRACGSVQTIF